MIHLSFLRFDNLASALRMLFRITQQEARKNIARGTAPEERTSDAQVVRGCGWLNAVIDILG